MCILTKCACGMALVFDVLVFEIRSHLTQVGLELVIYLEMTLNSDSPVSTSQVLEL